jgi:hypothetical protein
VRSAQIVTLSLRNLTMSVKHVPNRVIELAERGIGSRRRRADEVSPARRQCLGVLSDGGAQLAPNAVPYHGIADVPADCVRHARRLGRRTEQAAAHFDSSLPAAAASRHRTKCCAITNSPDQADRLARPLLRRRAITARPPRVRIRPRNPWVFFRFRLFG